jgi:hypothetical protein
LKDEVKSQMLKGGGLWEEEEEEDGFDLCPPISVAEDRNTKKMSLPEPFRRVLLDSVQISRTIINHFYTQKQKS